MLKNNNFFLYLASFFILIITYLPNLQFDFLYADDYAYLFPKIGESLAFKILLNTETFYDYFIKIGRPITGHLIFIQSFLIDNINQAKILRLFSIVLLWIIFIILFNYFTTKQLSKFESFFISLSVVSLPSFNLSVTWLTLQASLISVIFSIYAFLLLKNLKFKNFFDCYFRICLSILLIIFSLFLYPVASMFFFILHFIDFFLCLKTK